MKKVEIYANGLVYCSVCVEKDLTIEEIEKEVNLQNFTGIYSNWKISESKFEDGSENPQICEKDNNRIHYLLSC